MAKSDAEALNKLKELVDSGETVQIDKKFGGYEITVWINRGDKLSHHHFNGESLTETVMKIKL